MKPKAFYPAFIILSFIIANSPLLHSQSFYWTDPLPISDSNSNNRNAVIKEVRYIGSHDFWLFWERSVDTNSTEIYCCRFYNPEEPVAVVTGGDFHFTNVQIIPTSNDNDTLFYMFYESDQNGNKDIFYKIYTLNGFTDPVLFVGTDYDDTHFRCNDDGMMVWQEGDKIKYARLTKWNSPFIISDPVTIDSINCSEPEIAPYNFVVGWLKNDVDSSFIFYSHWNGSWSAPVLVDGSENITSLKFAQGEYDNLLSWESIIEDEHTILARYLAYGDVYVSDFHQQTSFTPMIFLYSMPVGNFYANGYMTFVYSEDQNDEIYVNAGEFYISPNLEDYDNISSSPYQEANPVFFTGDYFGSYFDLINIWESKRNDHWQLYYTKKSLLWGGGTPETEQPLDARLNISPNPFRNECDINYTLTEDASVSLQLCTPDGRQITLTDQKFLQKGTYTYHLNFYQVFPGQNYSGLFMVRLQSGNNSVAQKAIKMR